VMVLLALALFGASRPERPLALDAALLVATFAALWAVARAVQLHDGERQAPLVSGSAR